MKLSDYVMKTLADWGIKDVFMLPGGGCMHLVDSLGKQKSLNYIPMFHEQAIAIAMDAYAQYKESMAVGLVTTGPGGTNTVTGCTASWIDSTPVLYLSGQVKRSDSMEGKGLRQMGPQEVDIVSIVSPITKYAITVNRPEEIKYHLQKAFYLANNGRKGPVWLDIPLDVQGAEIDEKELSEFFPEPVERMELDLSKFLSFINEAKRPLFLIGNGVRLSKSMEKVLCFCEAYHIPMLFTWKVTDALPYTHPLNFGSPGIMGMRYSNIILQNSDLLVIMGSRLDNSIVAFQEENFGKSAKRVIIDIDKNEVNKLNSSFEEKIIMDIAAFMERLFLRKKEIQPEPSSDWITFCKKMKENYPVVLQEYYEKREYVDSYVFVEELSKQLKENDIIVPESSGGAGEITYQAIKMKRGQKMRNAAGLGSMGFGLPYSIGACIAMDRKKTVLINGDGAFQLNIQELQTVIREKLPIKIFIWSNDGYASIKNTQTNLFEGNIVAADSNSKLVMPDIRKIAESYGFRTGLIRNNLELEEGIAKALKGEEPYLCEVLTNPYQTVVPKVQSVKLENGSMMSMPIENMFPFLSEEELKTTNYFEKA